MLAEFLGKSIVFGRSDLAMRGGDRLGLRNSPAKKPRNARSDGFGFHACQLFIAQPQRFQLAAFEHPFNQQLLKNNPDQVAADHPGVIGELRFGLCQNLRRLPLIMIDVGLYHPGNRDSLGNNILSNEPNPIGWIDQIKKIPFATK